MYHHIAVFSNPLAARLAAMRGVVKDVLKPVAVRVEDDAVIFSTTEKVVLDDRLQALSDAQRAVAFCSFRFNQVNCSSCGYLAARLYHVGTEECGRDMCMDCIRQAVASAPRTTEPLQPQPQSQVVASTTAALADVDCGLGIVVQLPVDIFSALDEKKLKKLADKLADQVLYHILPLLMNDSNVND